MERNGINNRNKPTDDQHKSIEHADRIAEEVPGYWDTWKRREYWTLEEAVCLSYGKDPREYGPERMSEWRDTDRYQAASSSPKALKTEWDDSRQSWKVARDDFIRWITETGAGGRIPAFLSDLGRGQIAEPKKEHHKKVDSRLGDIALLGGALALVMSELMYYLDTPRGIPREWDEKRKHNGTVHRGNFLEWLEDQGIKLAAWQDWEGRPPKTGEKALKTLRPWIEAAEKLASEHPD